MTATCQYCDAPLAPDESEVCDECAWMFHQELLDDGQPPPCPREFTAWDAGNEPERSPVHDDICYEDHGRRTRPTHRG